MLLQPFLCAFTCFNAGLLGVLDFFFGLIPPYYVVAHLHLALEHDFYLAS
jgi:hypothetical protein